MHALKYFFVEAVASLWRGWRSSVLSVLTIGAGLFVQSLQRLRHVELGFDPSNVTTAMMGVQGERFSKPGAPWTLFYGPLLDRLASAPGVEGAAMSSGAPFGGGNTGMPVTAVGESLIGTAPLQTDWRMVIPAGILYGFTSFCFFLEGNTLILGLPFTAAVTILVLVWGRRKLAQQPVLSFFFVACLFAFVLFAGWGLYFGGFPPIMEVFSF